MPEFAQLLWERLINPPWQAEVVGTPKKWHGTWEVSLAFGAREARVHFSYSKHKSLGPSLRLELNPRKLGEIGFLHLSAVLGGGKSPASLGGLAASARVTRLDVAVDIVGLHVSEVVCHHEKQGIRSHYVGTSGRLETTLVHRQKSPLKIKLDEFGEPLKLMHPSKPAGVVIVSIYDRVAERAALGKPGPFGEAPVTRIELSRRRFKKQTLKGLLELGDVFHGFRAGYYRSQISGSDSRWRRYLALRLSMPHEDGARELALDPATADKFLNAFNVPQPNLIAPAVNWSQWPIGVHCVGLKSLIGAAV